MKKMNRLFGAVVFLVVMALPLGCRTAAPVRAPGTTTLPPEEYMLPAPAGLRYITFTHELRSGTILYNRSGTRVAIVRAVERKPIFRPGQVGVGILIQMITMWGLQRRVTLFQGENFPMIDELPPEKWTVR